jgi:DNA helicase-2/ATP-dependent DNA helicase PcrA
VAHLVGAHAREVWVSTFHSTCVRILRRDIEPLGYGRNFVIYDDDDQIRVLKQILADLRIDAKRHPPTYYRQAIDRAKNAFADPGQDGPRADRLPEVWRLYGERLRAANALDFNDLINKVVELWEAHPDVLARWQDRWRYVMVDEYQDTNQAQYRLVRLLAAREPNLAVVGDDDQSIYSFRGADIRNILDFEKDFPQATVVRLERNYRSTQKILRAASGLVRRNAQRKDKTLWTEGAEGEGLRFVACADELEEAERVVTDIRGLLRTRKPADIAVIYRTNAQSRPLEQALVAARIAHVLVGGKKFYERREVRDLVAYLKLLVNPTDDVAFQRIVNVPARGLGDKAQESIAAEAVRRDIPHREAARLLGTTGGRMGNALAALSMLLDRLERLALDLSPGELVMRVARDSGYLAELEAERTDESRGRIDNIGELARAADEDPDAVDPAEGEEAGRRAPIDALRGFLDRASLTAQADELPDDGQGAVTLLTAHLAKGLEYPVVFVVGMAEKCFPHARAERDEDIEEERRLAYVAITRARERLTLSWPQRRRGMGGMWEPTLPSRFLREIPPEVFDGPAPRPAPGVGGGPARPFSPPSPPSWLSGGRGATATAPRGPIAPPRAPAPTGLPAPGEALRRGPAPSAPAPATVRAPVDRRRMVPDSYEELAPGTEVFHAVLGVGVIQRREGIPSNPRLTIHFKAHGPRTVFAASAPLEILLP